MPVSVHFSAGGESVAQTVADMTWPVLSDRGCHTAKEQDLLVRSFGSLIRLTSCCHVALAGWKGTERGAPRHSCCLSYIHAPWNLSRHHSAHTPKNEGVAKGSLKQCCWRTTFGSIQTLSVWGTFYARITPILSLLRFLDIYDPICHNESKVCVLFFEIHFSFLVLCDLQN